MHGVANLWYVNAKRSRRFYSRGHQRYKYVADHLPLWTGGGQEQNRPVESIVFDDQVYSWPPFTPPYSDDGFSDDDSSQQSF